LTCSSFDGSGSFDPDGSILLYSWSYGDGTKTESGSTLSRPSHTYSAAGTYNVTLTVMDNSGMTGQATHSVTVAVPPPGG
jgi:PKD repeat protein